MRSGLSQCITEMMIGGIRIARCVRLIDDDEINRRKLTCRRIIEATASTAAEVRDLPLLYAAS